MKGLLIGYSVVALVLVSFTAFVVAEGAKGRTTRDEYRAACNLKGGTAIIIQGGERGCLPISLLIKGNAE